MSTLLSVNVGPPRDMPWRGRTIRSGMGKLPVAGRVMARRLNLDGDGQGDRVAHGGVDRAVLVYQRASYLHWQERLGRDDLRPGCFGENLTVDGLPDDEVCIGDRYRIGEAVFEVSQPRVTCYRVGIALADPLMPARLVAEGRPGFYCRVIREGTIGAGDPIERVASGEGAMSVAEIDRLLYLPGRSPDALRRALRIPALSPGWIRSVEALAAATGSDQTGDTVGWPGYRALRIASIQCETRDVLSFTLAAEDGSRLPPHRPGQFLAFRIVPEADAPPIVRNYSISGPVGTGRYRISVRHQDGPGSLFLHNRVKVGDVLHATAPRGDFVLDRSDVPVVLLSAGIGVTPLLSMLHALAADRSSRSVWWYHGTRNGGDHLFAEEVHAGLARLPHAYAIVAFSGPCDADERGRDYDLVGHLDLAALRQRGLPHAAEYYLCGPPAFVTDLMADLTAWGIPPERLHTESFGVATSGIVGGPAERPHSPQGPPGSGPWVHFRRSGITARWDTRHHSLLEFAEACAIPVRWSCRAGVCHMCETRLLNGSVGYAPAPLDPPSADKALICCATPRSALVLDL